MAEPPWVCTPQEAAASHEKICGQVSGAGSLQEGLGLLRRAEPQPYRRLAGNVENHVLRSWSWTGHALFAKDYVAAAEGGSISTCEASARRSLPSAR
jgi:hypothetical protein